MVTYYMTVHIVHSINIPLALHETPGTMVANDMTNTIVVLRWRPRVGLGTMRQSVGKPRVYRGPEGLHSPRYPRGFPTDCHSFHLPNVLKRKHRRVILVCNGCKWYPLGVSW